MGQSVIIRRRYVDRLFPSNPDYYLTTQGEIISANDRGATLRFPNGTECFATWGKVAFVRPQLSFPFASHTPSEQPNG